MDGRLRNEVLGGVILVGGMTEKAIENCVRDAGFVRRVGFFGFGRRSQSPFSLRVDGGFGCLGDFGMKLARRYIVLQANIKELL